MKLYGLLQRPQLVERRRQTIVEALKKHIKEPVPSDEASEDA